MAMLKKTASERGRAWIELDRQALKNNADVLKSLLPPGCELMPAVKAEAYGHGGAIISRELNRMGIHSFCVACASEGVKLRRSGVRGTILILGYTHPQDFDLLRRWDLTQTVLDYPYALSLNSFGKKLKVHLGIDTGMRRLGERCENIDRICEIFQMENLKIKGIYTHLCAADDSSDRGMEFTEKQIRSFYGTIGRLRDRGIVCPKVHMLASSGILNYPKYAGDYARVGIALYGVLSTSADWEKCGLPLKPVLSLKARVTSIKNMYQGEHAGYGLDFTAQRNTKAAVLSIGYADGLPRCLSNGAGSVLINGRRAPVIGRICMDQTTVDATDIPDLQVGDEAVLIGRSGSEEITAMDLAGQAGTITNEILSRLGSRLERILI